jgi:hypothetical protein
MDGWMDGMEWNGADEPIDNVGFRVYWMMERDGDK